MGTAWKVTSDAGLAVRRNPRMGLVIKEARLLKGSAVVEIERMGYPEEYFDANTAGQTRIRHSTGWSLLMENLLVKTSSLDSGITTWSVCSDSVHVRSEPNIPSNGEGNIKAKLPRNTIVTEVVRKHASGTGSMHRVPMELHHVSGANGTRKWNWGGPARHQPTWSPPTPPLLPPPHHIPHPSSLAQNLSTLSCPPLPTTLARQSKAYLHP